MKIHLKKQKSHFDYIEVAEELPKYFA